MTIKPSDDRRHRPAPGRKGRDSLFFNLILPEHELAVQLYTWVDDQGVAGRQVSVWGPERTIVTHDFEVNVAMGDADFDDWRIAGLEIRHPDPLQTAEIRFRSDQVSLAYDFAGSHQVFSYARNATGCPQWMAEDRFEQAGRATGELVIGERVVAFDATAHRDHSWGRRHWGIPHHWKWVVGQTGSGRAFNLMSWIARGEPGINGYVSRGTEVLAIADVRAHAVYDDDMTQRRLEATLVDESGAHTEVVLDRFGLLPLPFSDTIVFEAACRATIDGEPGSGQFECLWPAAYVETLTTEER